MMDSHCPSPYGQAHQPILVLEEHESGVEYSQEGDLSLLNDNLYTLQFYCLDDSKWVMEEGPWNFLVMSWCWRHMKGLQNPCRPSSIL